MIPAAAFHLALVARVALPMQVPQVVDFDDVFEWIRPLELQQTERTIVANPQLQSDAFGGWLVLDKLEGQVRLHELDGRLAAWFGRRGGGPGEFTNLVSVLRTRSGELLTVDMQGRFALRSEDGSRLLNDFRIPLIGITGAEWINGDSLLVVTPPRFSRSAPSGPILHVIDVANGRLVRSFYQPTIPANALTAWATFYGGGVSSQDSLLAVTQPLLDTLLIFRDGSEPVARIPLGVLGDASEIPNGQADPTAFREWARSITGVGPVLATAAGWFVPLIPTARQARERRELVFIGRADPEPILVRNAPILIGVDQRTGDVVFDDPDQLEPQFLRIARLRPRRVP